LEVGPPLGPEGDDLTVEDRGAAAEGSAEGPDLGVVRRDVEEVAALEPDASPLAVEDGPHAVPLDLVRPLFVIVG
jgi:hypothetical protein